MDKVKQLIEEIIDNDRIVISRHIRPDGDAVGASKGLACVLKASFPQKEILVINEDYSDFLSFLGGEDSQLSQEEYKSVLSIVVDTGTIDRVSNPYIVNSRRIIKIDHHIDDIPFGDISLVEDFRSSCCEIIANIVKENPDTLKMTKEAAYYLYTGMVTDSGRFKFAETTGDTLRIAAYLVDFGIDIQSIYENLYLESIYEFSMKGKFYNMIEFTESGVGYIYFSLDDLKNFNISTEIASNTVDLMSKIKGTNIWMTFIETDEGKIRVRLRSRRIDVQTLATKYHGGGHLNASGATCYSKEEVQALLNDADLIHRLA